MLAGDARLIDKLRREDLIPLGSRIRTRLATEHASREELIEGLAHLLTGAGNATLMTQQLRHTLCDHAAGNYRTHEPGRWFATARTLKLFDRATQLAWASPRDPKTLTRAARDHLTKQPHFAMQAALAALHWMSMGHGYELTALDAHEAHRLATEAAANAQQTEQAQATIDKVLAQDRPMSAWLRRSLGLPPAALKPGSA